jgi:hypothetical protein
MSEDGPAVSEAAARALQVAYEVFHEQGEWPSFQYVDHRLDREGYDANAAVREMPNELGFFDKRNPRRDFVVLTVAGIAQAGDSEADCELFIRLLRWCVAREAAFAPTSPTGPDEALSVTSEQFEQESEGPPLNEVDQRKVLSFLRTENLTSGSGGPGAPPEIWSATLDYHRLRAFRDIDTIEAYLARRAAEFNAPAQSLARRITHGPAPASRFVASQLERGRRVNIVKEAAAALSAMGDVDRSLTLTGFGIDGEPLHEDGDYASSARLLMGVEDGTLLELAAHLRESRGAPEDRDDGPWEPDHFRLFVSHTHAYAAELSALKRELEPFGIDAFVAHVDIRPTDLWQTVIEAALRTCDALGAYLTEDFAASDWTDQEVGWVAGRGRLILPIQHTCIPYGFVGKWQSVKASRPDLADGLLGLLCGNDLTAGRMAEVNVTRFEATKSTEAAQKRFELLERITLAGWSSELLARVERAVSENAVLAAAEIHSTPVPALVAELLAERRAQADGG